MFRSLRHWRSILQLHSTIYAGTSGSGLFKTTNGGNSWTAINNGITTGFGGNPAVVDDIVIDSFNSSTLYINVVGKINKSTNGGNSWSLVNNSAVAGGINAMVADRTNPSTLYVGTVGGGVIKTTDGGTSWTSVNTGLWTGIIRVLVVDPSNSAVLYAGGSDTDSHHRCLCRQTEFVGLGLVVFDLFGRKWRRGR